MYTQEKLRFELDALEPYMDKENLDIHYNKHHLAYIKNYNAAVEGSDLVDKDLRDVLSDLGSVPADIKTNVINMGGGAWNHSFFWSVLCSAKESGEPTGELMTTIEKSFGSFEDFKKQFSEAAATVFGSGWAWLVKGEGSLEIMKTSNQDCPLSLGKKPILTLDVWEHAYYLKYKNRRPEFIDAWWNVVNWKKVGEYFGG